MDPTLSIFLSLCVAPSRVHTIPFFESCSDHTTKNSPDVFEVEVAPIWPFNSQMENWKLHHICEFDGVRFCTEVACLRIYECANMANRKCHSSRFSHTWICSVRTHSCKEKHSWVFLYTRYPKCSDWLYNWDGYGPFRIRHAPKVSHTFITYSIHLVGGGGQSLCITESFLCSDKYLQYCQV